MARLTKRLTTRGAAKKRALGYHADGEGLYLQVTGAGARSWIFRYRLHGRLRDMGLGPLADVSLDQARQFAKHARELVRRGEDPIEHRNERRRERARAAAGTKTFDECVAAYIDAMKDGWRNTKHRDQWKNTLATYASPAIGDLPVRDVATEDVRRVLDPIWRKKPETASRVRGRIERILDWATLNGYREEGPNPARWRGHLANNYPPKAKVQATVRPVRHHPALPYRDVGAFMKESRSRDGIAAASLQFIILTAARVSEAVGATWGEIDLGSATWTVPKARMKANRAHRVALSKDAVRLLKSICPEEAGAPKAFVFPGGKLRRPLTIAAPLKVLHDMGRKDITVHGFRSSFRDWAAEQTNFPRQVVEAALAHVVGDATEAAYLRTDLLDRRRPLMETWAQHCAHVGVKANVVPMRTPRRSR